MAQRNIYIRSSPPSAKQSQLADWLWMNLGLQVRVSDIIINTRNGTASLRVGGSGRHCRDAQSSLSAKIAFEGQLLTFERSQPSPMKVTVNQITIELPDGKDRVQPQRYPQTKRHRFTEIVSNLSAPFQDGMHFAIF